MVKDQKPKGQKQISNANVLESIKDLGGGVGTSVKKDLLGGIFQDSFDQIFSSPFEKKYSGDLMQGEALEIKDVFSGREEENQRLKKQIFFEKSLLQEEKLRSQKKSNELRVQLQAITQEVVALAQTTQNLSQDVEIAAMQAPASPGVYHIIFFEKLLEFIRSFRKKIESADIWLHATNKRAEKKNYWNMYRVKKGSFLLAPDHYLQRSAG